MPPNKEGPETRKKDFIKSQMGYKQVCWFICRSLAAPIAIPPRSPTTYLTSTGRADALVKSPMLSFV